MASAGAGCDGATETGGQAVICPECRDTGQRSRVTEGVSYVTDMYCPPFWDEDGVQHVHDVNRRTTNFSCSNGHQWAESASAPCPVCGPDWR